MQQLFDNHGRAINYLRLSVTDRCNLRCFYCMPREDMEFSPRSELMSLEELERLVRISHSLGIEKVRITGGEPFVRKNLIEFLENISAILGPGKVHLTSNGVLIAPYIDRLEAMGIGSVNLSLDTLDRENFRKITFRDELPAVMEALDLLLGAGIKTKVNAVVMDGKNTDEIASMASLSKEKPVDVRFIEEMPFNESGAVPSGIKWNHKHILDELKQTYPDIAPVGAPANSTALDYQIPGHQGKIGIIPAFSRTFCGSCNRVRVNAKGALRTCLYGSETLSIRDLMRDGLSDEAIAKTLASYYTNRHKNGFEAEEALKTEGSSLISMSKIGG